MPWPSLISTTSAWFSTSQLAAWFDAPTMQQRAGLAYSVKTIRANDETPHILKSPPPAKTAA